MTILKAEGAYYRRSTESKDLIADVLAENLIEQRNKILNGKPEKNLENRSCRKVDTWGLRYEDSIECSTKKSTILGPGKKVSFKKFYFDSEGDEQVARRLNPHWPSNLENGFLQVILHLMMEI